MTKLIDLLRGKKTYIVAVLMGCLVAAHSAGLIDEHSFDEIRGALEALGLATVAAKINRVGAAVE